MIPWLDVACPICPAQPGEQCHTDAGVVLVYPHAERTRLAERLGTCPDCLSVEKVDKAGLIRPHKQMYGIARTDIDCPGAGQKPEVDE